jgi:hypothetical protein
LRRLELRPEGPREPFRRALLQRACFRRRARAGAAPRPVTPKAFRHQVRRHEIRVLAA